MYRLFDIVKSNWLTDYKNSKNDSEGIKKIGFRHVKPLQPYSLKNLIGVQIKFRTWITSEQHFSSVEHTVDDNQTISFCFSTTNTNQRLQTRTRTNSIVASLVQTDRRLLISMDGWECLKPISIDRIGTFFRVAIPSDSNQLYKPVLVIIDIALTNNSIRSITVKSSIEIRNQLLTSIDIRFESSLDLLHDFRLEPNEIRSLPIQLCSMLKQVEIRPADFALDYCDEPITWLEIEKESIFDAKRDDNR
jgi:vacuolar protein sorting-associated protein 13D